MALIGVVVVFGLVSHVGCSREDREEAVNRFASVGKTLNGKVRSDDVEHQVPNIVADQQRKERIRQNTTWTTENRALHPIEYCQAQLDELDKYLSRLDVVAHEVATKKAEVTRVIGEQDGRVANINKFLKEAKEVYRTCEASNSWPAKIGGFSLSKDAVRSKIVDAAQKVPTINTRIDTMRNQLVHLEKKSELITKEQKRLVDLHERIEVTISDLQLKRVVSGEKGISDALNVINDAMGSLGVDYDNPSLDELIAPDRESATVMDFEKIMAE